MVDVISRFEERVVEIDSYYNVLDLLTDPRVDIVKRYQRYSKVVSLDNEALKILKSTCFLLLYNLIESTIRDSFSNLYDKINTEPGKHDDYNEQFQRLWLDQHFKIADPYSSNQNTYKNIVSEIIDKIISESPLSLDSNKLPISGNLDARRIRKLFSDHNIKLKVHHKAFGGGELRTVKDNRNDLAHGSISFTDCGQQYTIGQLQNIKKRTIIYLRSTLRYLRKFSDNRGYAAI
ncbi:MAG: MAE_28990/MAE_18760 family HEPN-like nuclease [Bacteroidota bacterium]